MSGHVGEARLSFIRLPTRARPAVAAPKTRRGHAHPPSPPSHTPSPHFHTCSSRCIKYSSASCCRGPENSEWPRPTSDLKDSGRTAFARTASSPVSAAPVAASPPGGGGSGGGAAVSPVASARPTFASCVARSCVSEMHERRRRV
eukprot:259293-Chlamydomonas_euryale.AAC.1